MSNERVETFKRIMDHQDHIIMGWMQGYKMKRFTYTEALEHAVLDLASQKQTIIENMQRHYETCVMPIRLTSQSPWIAPSGDPKKDFVPPNTKFIDIFFNGAIIFVIGLMVLGITMAVIK